METSLWLYQPSLHWATINSSQQGPDALSVPNKKPLKDHSHALAAPQGGRQVWPTVPKTHPSESSDRSLRQTDIQTDSQLDRLTE